MKHRADEVEVKQINKELMGILNIVYIINMSISVIRNVVTGKSDIIDKRLIS